MKTTGFDYVVRIGIIFTMPEILNMIWLAEHHYDGRCKDAARPGGILFGIKNTAEWELADKLKRTPWPLSFRDVDTLAKITEPIIQHEKNMLGMHLKFRSILNELNEEYGRLNPGKA
jgi:hypothetical protein